MISVWKNRFPGVCRKCSGHVAVGQGVIGRRGFNAGFWVEHVGCNKPAVVQPGRPPKPPAQPNSHWSDSRYGHYSASDALSDPLPIAASSEEIAYHLAQVKTLARQYRMDPIK